MDEATGVGPRDFGRRPTSRTSAMFSAHGIAKLNFKHQTNGEVRTIRSLTELSESAAGVVRNSVANRA